MTILALKIFVIQFTTLIKKFGDQGEKTGWTYVEISAALAEKLKPNNKKSFRIRGSLDNYKFEGMALIPMGEGNFILALKADVRKKIRKQKGDSLKLLIEADNNPVNPNNLLQ
jgi:hypothetical protein